MMYNLSIKGLGSTKSGIFANLVPIFGVFFSYLILGELITTSFYIGLLLILSGILVMNLDYKLIKCKIDTFLLENRPQEVTF